MPKSHRITLRNAAVALITGLLLQGNAYALEPQPDSCSWQKAGEVTFDLVILRPLQLAAMGAGIVFFVPAVLLSAPGGPDSYHTAEGLFIIEPARAVFRRPLGDF